MYSYYTVILNNGMRCICLYSVFPFTTSFYMHTVTRTHTITHSTNSSTNTHTKLHAIILIPQHVLLAPHQ